MSLPREEEQFLSETWKEISSPLRVKKPAMSYLDFRQFFIWFKEMLKKSGIEAPSPYPPYWDMIWDELDLTLSRGEVEIDVIEEVKKRGGKIEEDETPADVWELLTKLDLELPMEDDPDYQRKLEDVLRELLTRVLTAEKTAGKVEVKVAGKTQHWGSKKVTEFVAGLNSKISELEARLEAEEKRRKRAEREAKLVKFTPLKSFEWYIAGKEYETEDKEWALERQKQGLIRIIEKEAPPPPPPAPPVPVVPEELMEVHMMYDVPAETVRGTMHGPFKASSIYALPKWLAEEFISRKIAEKYVVKPPTVAIEEKGLAKEDEQHLREHFTAGLRNRGVVPTRFMDDFKVELEDIIKTIVKDLPRKEAYEQALSHVDRLVDDIAKREIVLAPPKPPPMPPWAIRRKEILEMFPPPARGPFPGWMDIWRWLLEERKIDLKRWAALSDQEKSVLKNEYLRWVKERIDEWKREGYI